MPDPVPLDVVSVSHAALLDDVHAHPACVVTVKVPVVVPPAGIVTRAGVTEKVQDALVSVMRRV